MSVTFYESRHGPGPKHTLHPHLVWVIHNECSLHKEKCKLIVLGLLPADYSPRKKAWFHCNKGRFDLSCPPTFCPPFCRHEPPKRGWKCRPVSHLILDHACTYHGCQNVGAMWNTKIVKISNRGLKKNQVDIMVIHTSDSDQGSIGNPWIASEKVCRESLF